MAEQIMVVMLSNGERKTVQKVEQACFDVHPDYVAELVNIIKIRFPELGDNDGQTGESDIQRHQP
jgi:hypothetical protein